MSAAAKAILDLLEARGAGKTICPSEVARALAAPHGDWRAEMAVVHAAVDALMAQGAISLTWRGAPKRERRGPYRIARRTGQP